MPISLADILTSLQQGVQAINNNVQATNNLTAAIKTIFPQITGTSTTAPSSSAPGTITFTSSQAVGFQLVTLPSGQTVKVPYYHQ